MADLQLAAGKAPRLYLPFMAGLYAHLSGLAYPLIRFFTGLMLMPHGGQKLFGWFGGNIEGTAGFFAKIGLEPALALAYLVGVVEFFGGLLLALGLFTRVAAGCIVVLLLVAAFKVHLGSGYFWNAGGYEYPLYWAIVSLAILLRGGGELSLDRAIGREF